jgi:hypothetical protein
MPGPAQPSPVPPNHADDEAHSVYAATLNALNDRSLPPLDTRVRFIYIVIDIYIN